MPEHACVLFDERKTGGVGLLAQGAPSNTIEMAADHAPHLCRLTQPKQRDHFPERHSTSRQNNHFLYYLWREQDASVSEGRRAGCSDGWDLAGDRLIYR